MRYGKSINPVVDYRVKPPVGTLGALCIYQAVSEEALREHARRTDMPADEITPVANTVVIREDSGREIRAA